MTQSRIDQLKSFTRQLLHFTNKEIALFMIPVGSCVGIAGLYALPSVATAVLTHSLLPTYITRMLYFGIPIGAGAVLYSRLSNLAQSSDDLDIQQKSKDEYVGLINIKGHIHENFFDEILPTITAAFADTHSKGVIIKINSKSGLAAQATNVQKEIFSLKNKYHKKVVIVAEDYLGGPAYYIALAGTIYVNQNTRIDQLTIDSALLTQNKPIENVSSQILSLHKDGSRQITASDFEKKDNPSNFLSDLQADFNSSILEHRKDKLSKDLVEKQLPMAPISGKAGLSLGLVDAIGSLSDVMKKEFDVECTREYAHRLNSISENSTQLLIKSLSLLLRSSTSHLTELESTNPVKAKLY